MRSRIMVIGGDAQTRADLARVITSGGYRAEAAVSSRRPTGGPQRDRARCYRGGGWPSANSRRRGAARGGRPCPCRCASRRARIEPRFHRPVRRGRSACAHRPGARAQTEPEAAEPLLEFEGHRLDFTGHTLKNPAGKEVPLRPAEFSLLGRSHNVRGGAVRDQLLQLVAGRDAKLTTAASTCR